MTKRSCVSLLFFCTSLCFAQIRSDFLLADSASGPNLTLTGDKKLYVAWVNTHDSNIPNVVFNIFDDMFNPTRPILQMTHTYTPGAPHIAVGYGGSLISWGEANLGIGARYIYGQLLNSEGDTVGGNFRVDLADYSVADRRAPDAAYLNDTSFVVTWWGNGLQTAGDLNGLYGRFGSSISGMIGPNIHLSSDRPPVNGFTEAKVAANELNGNFMAIWLEREFQTSKPLLLGRIFDQNGIPKTSSAMLTADTLYDDLWSMGIQCDANGQYVIVWSERRGTSWYIKLRRLDDKGSQVGVVENVNPDGRAEVYPYPDIAIDTNGDFLVVWEQPENDRSKIYGQRYSRMGNAIGTNFKVSFSPDTAYHLFPSIALRQKKIFAVWVAALISSEVQTQVWGKVLDFDNPVSKVENMPITVPLGFSLLNNFPNPFNPATNIEYRIELPRAHVQLDIYDVKGQLIRRLVKQTQTNGSYKVSWNGTDYTGKTLASGIYFASLDVNGKRQVKKLVLLQ